MITNIKARTFWNAENALTKRNAKQKEMRVRKEVEKQLHEQLKSVKTGSLRRTDVKAVVKVNGQFFPRSYEKSLSKRGFVALPIGEYNSNENTQTFYVVIKGFETQYPKYDWYNFGE